MKVKTKFILFLVVLFVEWFFLLFFACRKDELPCLLEVAKSFPGLFLITICYYALCNICYSILFIGDCEKEKENLLNDLKEGEEFFKSKNIKYN